MARPHAVRNTPYRRVERWLNTHWLGPALVVALLTLLAMGALAIGGD